MEGDHKAAVGIAFEGDRLAAGVHVPDTDHVIFDAGGQQIRSCAGSRRVENVRGVC